MADFEGIYSELRKIGMNSVCQGKSTMEKYISFKYKLQFRKIKVNCPVSLLRSGILKKKKSVPLFSVYNWIFKT